MDEDFKLIILTILLSILLIFGLCITSSYAQFGLAMPPCNMKSITGTLSVTSGSTTQLTDATNGGYWSSSTTTIATVNSSGLVSGVATGTSTISYSLSNYCLATSVVTVGGVATDTWNPSNKSSSITLSNGNLTVDASVPSFVSALALSTFSHSSGKYYYEVTITAASGYTMIGFGATTESVSDFTGDNTTSYGYYLLNGNCFNNGSAVFTASAYAAGDVVGVAVDLSAGKAWVAKNGTWQHSGNPDAGTGNIFSSISGVKVPIISTYQACTATANFGATTYAYPPSSHNASTFGNW